MYTDLYLLKKNTKIFLGKKQVLDHPEKPDYPPQYTSIAKGYHLLDEDDYDAVKIDYKKLKEFNICIAQRIEQKQPFSDVKQVYYYLSYDEAHADDYGAIPNDHHIEYNSFTRAVRLKGPKVREGKTRWMYVDRTKHFEDNEEGYDFELKKASVSKENAYPGDMFNKEVTFIPIPEASLGISSFGEVVCFPDSLDTFRLGICGMPGCLAYSTRLLGTSDSIKNSFKRSRFVQTWSFDFNEKKIVKSQSEMIPSGKKQILKIILDDGRVVNATEEHKFFVKRDDVIIEIEVKDLKEGDLLATTNQTPDYKYEHQLRMSKMNSNLDMHRKIRITKMGFDREDYKYDIIYDFKTNNMLVKEIAIKYNVSCSGLKKWLTLWGIKKEYWSEEEIEFLRKNYYDTSIEIIKNRLSNKTLSSIRHKAERNGLKRNKKFERAYLQNLNITNNPSKWATTREKNRRRMLEFISKNPEKMLNRMLRRNKKTFIEEIVENILKKNKIPFLYNHYVKTDKGFKFPDFVIKDSLIIECDGARFHQDKEKEKNRNKQLIKMGYKILHFSGKKIIKNTKGVEKCILKEVSKIAIC